MSLIRKIIEEIKKYSEGEILYPKTDIKVQLYKEKDMDLEKDKTVTIDKNTKLEIQNVTPQEIVAKIIDGKYKGYFIIINKNEIDYDYNID